MLAHSDVSHGRKIDPGEYFPWGQLAKAGIGHYVTPSAINEGPRLEPGASGPEVEALQAMLTSYGYGLDISGLYDAVTKSAIIRLPAPFPAGPRRRDRGSFDHHDLAAADRLIGEWISRCPWAGPAQ